MCQALQSVYPIVFRCFIRIGPLDENITKIIDRRVYNDIMLNLQADRDAITKIMVITFFIGTRTMVRVAIRRGEMG